MTAAIVGACAYAILHSLGVPEYIDVWIVVAIVMALRLASEYFGWETPEASEVPERMTAMGGTLLATPRRVLPSTRRGPDSTRHQPGAPQASSPSRGGELDDSEGEATEPDADT
jgi:hypothetical protein